MLAYNLMLFLRNFEINITGAFQNIVRKNISSLTGLELGSSCLSTNIASLRDFKSLS